MAVRPPSREKIRALRRCRRRAPPSRHRASEDGTAPGRAPSGIEGEDGDDVGKAQLDAGQGDQQASAGKRFSSVAERQCQRGEHGAQSQLSGGDMFHAPPPIPNTTSRPSDVPPGELDDHLRAGRQTMLWPERVMRPV